MIFLLNNISELEERGNEEEISQNSEKIKKRQRHLEISTDENSTAASIYIHLLTEINGNE